MKDNCILTYKSYTEHIEKPDFSGAKWLCHEYI